MMPRCIVLLAGFFVIIGYAARPAQAQQNPEAGKTVERLMRVEDDRQAEAVAWAAQRRLPVTVRQRDGRRVLLVGLDAGRPVYLTALNREAALTTRTATLHPGNTLGLNLTGQGMEIGIWDGGVPLGSHQELTGRVTNGDAVSADDHATHVAGTLAAEGVRPEARGMAYRAHLRAYDWNNDASEMAAEARRGLLVSNHSYGVIAGWFYGDLEDNGDRWYWLGHPSISTDEDYVFGWYDAEAAQFDRVAEANPYLLSVVAAGNDRTDAGPTSGTYRALNTQGIWRTYDVATTPRPRDGGADGYDTIAGASLAKNVLTVGSIGLRSGTPRASRFSSFGPTDDGRIKPDLVGYGERVLSPVAVGPTRYAAFSGTSMATPNVAGSLTLLQQHHANLTGRSMRAATLKALALHTADDIGPPGPDYQHGWGLLNTEAAARHLATLSENSLAALEATLEDGIAFTRTATVTEAGPLRMTLSWTDRAGSRLPLRGPSSLDTPTPQLRNDLDLRLIHTATGATYLPYTLDPQTPAGLAVPGDNVVDPVEQIYLPYAEPGDYTLVVSHKDDLDGGDPQVFALIVSGAQSTARPVSVTHLEPDETVDRVLLTWQTAFERGPGRFLIQRARVTFAPGGERVVGSYALVGTVDGAGTTEQPQAYQFEDARVPAGRYRYQVLFDAQDARFLAASTDALVPAPEQFAVLSNYPNPFSGQTRLVLDLPEAQEVTLTVYDVLGRLVRHVHDGRLAAGRHELAVDASAWAPGIYMARLTTPTAARTHRMVVTR